MTIQEAALEYQYDVGIFYGKFEDEEGWYWEVNGGYSSVSGRHFHKSITSALDELIRFLKDFQPFEK